MALTEQDLQKPITETYIDDLVKLYRNASFAIVALIFAYALDHERKKAERKLDETLSAVDQGTRTWTSVQFPLIYASGIAFALASMKRANIPINISKGFTPIDQESVKALGESTYLDFLNTMKGVQRGTLTQINELTKIDIQSKIIKNKDAVVTLKKRTNDILKVLKEDGIVALKDKSGKQWRLDSYAEMLARTKQTEAHNQAVANRMIENGQDLVKITSHIGSCPLCAPWQGRIVSLTGATTGYPTLDDAKSAGLYHPNCEHTFNAIPRQL